jgi:hypothetical protein
MNARRSLPVPNPRTCRYGKPSTHNDMCARNRYAEFIASLHRDQLKKYLGYHFMVWGVENKRRDALLHRNCGHGKEYLASLAV